MTDFIKIQETWNRHEKKLDQSLKLNLVLLKKVNLSNARSKLNSLIWQNAATIIFFFTVAMYGIVFAIENNQVLHYLISGLVLAFWAGAFSFGSANQLKKILKLDYSLPILELQKKLIAIKLSILKYLRLIVWTLPFHLAFMIITFKSIYGVDIIAQNSKEWLAWNFALSGLFLVIAIYFQTKSIEENLNKKWINWLLQGSGSQINEALVFMKEIEEFEKEVV